MFIYLTNYEQKYLIDYISCCQRQRWKSIQQNLKAVLFLTPTCYKLTALTLLTLRLVRFQSSGLQTSWRWLMLHGKMESYSFSLLLHWFHRNRNSISLYFIIIGKWVHLVSYLSYGNHKWMQTANYKTSGVEGRVFMQVCITIPIKTPIHQVQLSPKLTTF